MEYGDLDGFNLVPAVQPGGFSDFVQLVVPELQRRRCMETRYDGQTRREIHFGPNHVRLPPEHAVYKALPAWTADAAAAHTK